MSVSLEKFHTDQPQYECSRGVIVCCDDVSQCPLMSDGIGCNVPFLRALLLESGMTTCHDQQNKKCLVCQSGIEYPIIVEGKPKHPISVYFCLTTRQQPLPLNEIKESYLKYRAAHSE